MSSSPPPLERQSIGDGSPRHVSEGSPKSRRSPQWMSWSSPSLPECSASKENEKASMPKKSIHWDQDLPKRPVSSGSESGFSPMSPSATDRVFPIRSVVSVDPAIPPTPLTRPETSNTDGFPGMVPSDSLQSLRQRSEAGRFPWNSPRQPAPVAKGKSPHHESKKKSTDVETPSKSPAVPPRRRNTSSPGNERSGGIARYLMPTDDGSTTSGSVTSVSGGVPLNAGVGSTAESMKSGSQQSTASQASQASQASLGGHVMTRFKHVLTPDGHAVITGRDGTDIQRCEDEPIHIPGAVQGFGVLIALREEEDDKFLVRIASENSKKLIGYAPRDLFRLENFCDILSDEQADNLLDHIDFIRDEDADLAANGPEVFVISIAPPGVKKTVKFWCAIHIHERNGDLIICEFELYDDKIYPLVPSGDATPEPPGNTIQSDPTPEELAESTVNMSKPLRLLKNARKRRGETAAMEVFNVMSQLQEQLDSAPNVEQFLRVLVGVVKELTDFHRVMVYQFDQSWNGKVVTELVDMRASRDLFKGLHFPASDIPKQARDLYKISKVRLLYDRDQETARLVCKTAEDVQTPLDLSYSHLRAMSPIHIKYLGNMGVRSSMSISITAFNELWGLIVCHSYGSKGMRVSFPIRKMCRLIGDLASRNIERLSYASRLQARKLINTMPTENKSSGYIIASSDDLLKLFDADFGLLSIRDETKILGKLEETQEALAMLEYLRLRKFTSVLTSQDVSTDFPDLIYHPGFSVIAGMLLVPLSEAGNDFIVFFRKGQLREVKWAGNPYDKAVQGNTASHLEPRMSFKKWSETVVGKSRDWSEDEIETAAVLCLVYGKFIEVWRQNEAVLQNSQLTKLLLANSAHEVRTPLNAIINYLEIALEGSLDNETRDNLAKSHSASKSLVHVINDLLELTKTEEGHELVKEEVFDLPSTIREATEMFRGDASRKKLDYILVEKPGFPHLVKGDQRRVRQVVSNIMANAIQHTTRGGIKVELWLTEREEERCEVDIVIEDTGTGMSPQKLDALFRELEQVQTADDEQPLMLADKDGSSKSKEEKRALGLGLAVVARLLWNMNGQLRLKSEEGRGSRFVIHLPFYLPPGQPMSLSEESMSTVPSQYLVSDGSGSPLPRTEEGEVMLINSATTTTKSPRQSLVRKNSGGSMNSLQSLKSIMSQSSMKSNKSEVERLIDAIQGTAIGTRIASDQHTQSSSGRRMSGSWRPSPSGESAAVSSLQDNLLRSRTHGATVHSLTVDSSVDLKPTIPEEYKTPTSDNGSSSYRTVFDGIDQATPKMVPRFNVLVAEDDPLNSKIIKKRLEKIGHNVILTINGEECANAYAEKPGSFDVVLMDMQMPIVDGMTSTKMIRSTEKSNPSDMLSRHASRNGRVPIFAVSASLLEKNRKSYVDHGFDGWILKPIDFKRLNSLMMGIVEGETRRGALYQPGQWEKGGWFLQRPAHTVIADTPSSGGSATRTNSDDAAGSS